MKMRGLIVALAVLLALFGCSKDEVPVVTTGSSVPPGIFGDPAGPIRTEITNTALMLYFRTGCDFPNSFFEYCGNGQAWSGQVLLTNVPGNSNWSQASIPIGMIDGLPQRTLFFRFGWDGKIDSDFIKSSIFFDPGTGLCKISP